MNAEVEQDRTHAERVAYAVWCCWPGNATFGAYLWGGVLIAAGAILLVDNLDLVPRLWIDALWPLLTIGVGMAVLGWAASQRR